jgi:hypothetical protein
MLETSVMLATPALLPFEGGGVANALFPLSPPHADRANANTETNAAKRNLCMTPPEQYPCTDRFPAISKR